MSAVIVDDNQDLVGVLSDYLSFIGIRVLDTGKNGKDALELCQKRYPDYLFLDLDMPKYDGFYALEELDTTKQKVIILTGNYDMYAEKLKKYTRIQILEKPFSANELTEIMQTVNQVI